jgi:cytochrome P450
MGPMTEGQAAATTPHYDPFQAYDDPYPVFQALRREAPVYYNADLSLWVLSRFDDVQLSARNPAVYSSASGVALDDESELYSPGAFLDYDPPDHERLRGAMGKHFTPKTIKQLEGTVRDKARSLLAPHLEGGEFDIAEKIARPLPAGLVCSLLGFPVADHQRLLDWFGSMIDKPPGQTDMSSSVWQANREMRAYVNDAADERMKTPVEDLLTVLVQAEADGAIVRDELIGMSIFVFYAGIMTTAGLIANSINNLDQFRDQRRPLVDDPGLLPTAVEELLRYDSPVQSVSRVLLEEVELHGTTIPAGERVLFLFGSANRDEGRWEDADRLDVVREKKRHLAFGEGIHHCLGAPLARLEGRVILEEVFATIPDYQVSGPVGRLFAPHERSIEHLPISFEPLGIPSDWEVSPL